ncbi:putative Mechanosensitive ion channel protein MscS [uncultured delta proteobacterium]|uniref:Putative Mechanosensitive ion channel protein MscS n=1 Tax=uncultured delta proteobacterium TaxID=34034 RepID=A0A212JPE0_9DELT|nr:putative Mechanosensitive ion channel protein MscS [uncultured delta proteobacterium]
MAATPAQPAVDTPLDTMMESLENVDVVGKLESTARFIGDELARNTFAHYLIAFAIAAGGIALIWLVKGLIAKLATRWLASVDRHRVDNEMAQQVGGTLVPLLYIFPIYFALDTLNFSPSLYKVLTFLLFVLFITRAVRFFSSLASFVTDAYLRRHEESIDTVVGRTLSPIIRVLFWTIGITIILDNMGFQISSLLAGLGIVGVAVGLAGQTILADFFGYLVILLDRPFSIGDYVSAGPVSGTVESIGLKTTRLRTLGGEVLVCPNGDITKQNIANYRLMYRRQRNFTFGIAYETPIEKVRAVPDMVREAASAISKVNIDRVFFTAFGDSSLNFEVYFTVPGRDFVEAQALQQELMLGVMDRFAKENITFAYPTTTMYLANPASLQQESTHA